MGAGVEVWRVLCTLCDATPWPTERMTTSMSPTKSRLPRKYSLPAVRNRFGELGTAHVHAILCQDLLSITGPLTKLGHAKCFRHRQCCQDGSVRSPHVFEHRLKPVSVDLMDVTWNQESCAMNYRLRKP
jgi:hypothetical protein